MIWRDFFYQAMDGDVYEKVQEAFMTLSKTELECCGITQECFSKVLCDSTMVRFSIWMYIVRSGMEAYTGA